MKTNNFTPKQAEEILTAVERFLCVDGSAYQSIKYIQEMQYDYLEHAVDESHRDDGGTDFRMTPCELNIVVMNNRILTDLLHGIQDAIWTENAIFNDENTTGQEADKAVK